MFSWSTILPARRNDYDGSPLAFYFVCILALIFTFRGCVHYFAADGGSGIIAGIPLETYPAGAVQTIINHAGVFGIGHLIEASLTWFVVFRYRSLIPFLLSIVLVTQVLGTFLFFWKPLPVIPPGQVGIYITLPLTFVIFLLSIKKSASQTASDSTLTKRTTKEIA